MRTKHSKLYSTGPLLSLCSSLLISYVCRSYDIIADLDAFIDNASGEYTSLSDRSLLTGIDIPATDDYAYDQYIWITWPGNTELVVNGVYLATDEARMTSGTIWFENVDYELCPDTSGVGVDAVGGVFNCGLTTTDFYLYCDPACEPALAVLEVRIWTDFVVSHLGTPYRFEGNQELQGYPYDMEKVFKTGTYDTTTWNTMYGALKSTDFFAGLCLDFGSSTTITAIITLLTDKEGGPYGTFALAFADQTITGSFVEDVTIHEYSTNEYYSLYHDATATDFCLYRKTGMVHSAKIIILGPNAPGSVAVCDPTDETEPLSLTAESDELGGVRRRI